MLLPPAPARHPAFPSLPPFADPEATPALLSSVGTQRGLSLPSDLPAPPGPLLSPWSLPPSLPLGARLSRPGWSPWIPRRHRGTLSCGHVLATERPGPLPGPAPLPGRPPPRRHPLPTPDNSSSWGRTGRASRRPAPKARTPPVALGAGGLAGCKAQLSNWSLSSSVPGQGESPIQGLGAQHRPAHSRHSRMAKSRPSFSTDLVCEQEEGAGSEELGGYQ